MANRETSGVGDGSERGTAEKAKDTARDVKDTAREVKDRAQEKVSSAASEARDRGGDLVHEGKEKARSQADQQKDRVSEGFRSVADALRRGGQELSEEHRQYGSFLGTVADRAEGVSRYLDQRDVDSLTRDARQAAREHTPVFLSGAFTLGMLGARFLKSSGDKSGTERYDGPAEPYDPGTPRRQASSPRRYGSPSAPTDYGRYQSDELSSTEIDRSQETRDGGYA